MMPAFLTRERTASSHQRMLRNLSTYLAKNPIRKAIIFQPFKTSRVIWKLLLEFGNRVLFHWSAFLYLLQWYHRTSLLSRDTHHKLSPSGTLLSQFSRETDNSYTEKIAVDEYGRIFVTDLSKESIQVFDSSGNHLGDIPGMYDEIVLDQQNNLYANEELGGVVKFQVRPGGTPVANNASGNLNSPVVPTPTPAFANNTAALSGTGTLSVSNMMLTNDGHLVLGYADG